MPSEILGKDEMTSFEESSADLSSELMKLNINDKLSIDFNVND
jgi:hypothetical protein